VTKTSTLHEDQYTFLIIIPSVLRVRNFSDRICKGHKKAHFMFNNICFRKSYLVWDNVEYYDTAGQATDDYGACALHAG